MTVLFPLACVVFEVTVRDFFRPWVDIEVWKTSGFDMGTVGSGVGTTLALPFSLSIGFNGWALPLPLPFADAVSKVNMTLRNWLDTYKP